MRKVMTGVMRLTVALLVALSASIGVAGALNDLPAQAAPVTRAAPHSKQDGGSLSITQPSPQNGIVEGPVGANMVITGSGLTPGDIYDIGYAAQGTGCATGDTDFSSVVTAQAQSDGTLTVAFAWPSDAATVGASYYVCAKDTTTTSNPILQSDATFLVKSASAPAITVTATSNFEGTPLPTPAPTNTLYQGGYAQISGSNFFPGGVTLFAQLTNSPFTAQQYNPNARLTVANDATILSEDNGSFTAIVKLPENAVGQFYLNVVSQDGSSSMLPSLVASIPITIGTPPATATPTVHATPTVRATPTSHRTTTPKPPSAKRIAAIIGLSSVSVLLFVIGIILLVSASLTSRQHPWQT
ncbi:MAG TPA: hypothetical protein VKQ36_08585 [Ktedonobacterales bacterium]|nr:hypothetical protein [Ktedonobacterales bacterium]